MEPRDGYQLTPESSPASPEAQAFRAFVDEHIWRVTADQLWKARQAASN